MEETSVAAPEEAFVDLAIIESIIASGAQDAQPVTIPRV